MSMFCLIISI